MDSIRPGLVAPLLLLLPCVARAQDEGGGLEFFERRIRPVLASRCAKCHSLEAEKVKGGLLVDSREDLLKGGNSGPAVVPGRPDRSLLVRAIRGTDDDMKMPPKGELLAAHEVADFEEWIRRGAPDPRRKDVRAVAARAALDLAEAGKFWSFRPLADTRGASVDDFLRSKFEEKGFRPAAPADKPALLRRATFDLTGLPPTPEELEAFLADDSPAAFGSVVDRLLASPRYGERWGRHWLDLVRYADTAGDSSDFPVPQAVRYRDWVIRAFNEDKPYDRFLREQVAGDLLPAATEEQRREQVVATGYLALARRFGIKPESFHHLTIEDTIDNLGRTVLGLALSCARCHDHKFDPIPTDDYYGLYGIFQSTRYPYPGSETTKFQKDFVPLAAPAEAESALGPHRERLAVLEAEVKRLEEARDPALAKAKKERDAFAMRPLPVETAYAVSEGTPRNASLQIKGDPDKPGPEVPRRFLQILGGQTLPPGTGGSGRLELAGWISDPSNPLTSRVMANRIWQHHFGRGIVATPSDFGRQGRPPSHPALLDFLARRFIEDGWSIKAMHRRLMLSDAYRRASTGAGAGDPDNVLLARFTRRRLSAEEIRDAMLALSGDLEPGPGGPHPFPPSTAWDYSQARPFTSADAAYDHRRRTVYWMTQRLRRRSFMEIFDGPDPNATSPARPASTTPLQALFVMNDPFVHERAHRFAARLIAARPDDPKRLELAYLLVYSRPPTGEEREEGGAYLREFRASLAEQGVPVETRSQAAWASLCRVFLASNEFMFVR